MHLGPSIHITDSIDTEFTSTLEEKLGHPDWALPIIQLQRVISSKGGRIAVDRSRDVICQINL